VRRQHSRVVLPAGERRIRISRKRRNRSRKICKVRRRSVSYVVGIGKSMAGLVSLGGWTAGGSGAGDITS
jgi:hypothetical protein